MLSSEIREKDYQRKLLHQDKRYNKRYRKVYKGFTIPFLFILNHGNSIYFYFIHLGKYFDLYKYPKNVNYSIMHKNKYYDNIKQDNN